MRLSVSLPDSRRIQRWLRGNIPRICIIGLLGLGGAGARLWAAPPPANGTPVMRQAANFIEWGRLKEARALLASALQEPSNQNNAALLAFYGHVLMQFGDQRDGMDMTKRAVALDKDCAACHLYLFEAMAQKAKAASQMRALLLLPKLKKQLQQAAAMDPDLGDVQWGWIKLDLQLPKSLGGGTDAALEHADALSKIDPVDGRLARASIFEATHQAEAALNEYAAAAKEHPEDPRGVFAFGQALYQRGDYARAEPNLARALKLNPKSALYSAYEAAALVRLKQLEAARTVLAQGKAMHPESRLGDYMAAEALRESGQDFSWARQLLASYLDVPPEPDQPSVDAARTLLAQIG